MRKEERTAISRRPHREEMKIYKFLIMCIFTVLLTGCDISFSDSANFMENGEEITETTTPNGAVEVSIGNEIKMQDITLRLPEGMKYGETNMDTGRVFYVWEADKPYVLPTDSDIIMYIYEGKDNASPDTELKDSEARYSISQNYVQTFRESVSGSIVADPTAVLNGDWFALQMTGYSGDYLMTTYGTMCYPKYYYGIFTLQKEKDAEKYNRRYYGFVFSNDGTGNIMSQTDYSDLLGQIKSGFSISEFYTAPQLPGMYDEAKDFSKGYSYGQYADLFTDTANYYGMSAEQAAEENEETTTAAMPAGGQEEPKTNHD